MNRNIHSIAFAIAALALAPVASQAQGSFPDKPITFVVPFAAGTATDQIARALGNGITAESKQAVVIDNKAGANTIVGADAVAKAAPDGYTLLMAMDTTLTQNQFLFSKFLHHTINRRHFDA